MTTSCSSSDDAREPVPSDADGGADAAPEADREDDVNDAGIKDVTVVDSAPLPIECSDPPCAIALSTTSKSGSGTREEGYCALLHDGAVACWGANNAGQLGDPNTIGDSPVPVRVPGLSKVTTLDHTCAVDSDGAAFCWGRGPFLQSEASATTIQKSPVQLPLPASATKVAVSPDGLVACAILRDESVVCWGDNRFSQVGLAIPTSERNAQPKTLELAAGAKNIAVGAATFTIHENGTLMSWGSSFSVGRPVALVSDGWPTKVALDHVSMVDTVGDEACAVANGIGWCWGAPDLAGGSLVQDQYARALPAAVDIPEPITRIATTESWNVTENTVTYREKHRWCATSVTGEVYCWGLNNAGQAGDGTKQFAIQTVRVAGLPAPAAEVKVMPYSTCAILTNGKVYCWGSNFYGQLGAGLPKKSVLTPVEVKLP
ncbi:MAG: hypothetical protein BGO98_28220 [Myxococcales bacterium 68-20]|nr:MAG: hypothetical protein BGO98_28220 [Myxococcales bacterium 68-20]